MSAFLFSFLYSFLLAFYFIFHSLIFVLISRARIMCCILGRRLDLAVLLHIDKNISPLLGGPRKTAGP